MVEIGARLVRTRIRVHWTPAQPEIDVLIERIVPVFSTQDAAGVGRRSAHPRTSQDGLCFASDELLEILAQHVEAAYVSPGGRLFTSGTDDPISPGTVSAWWQRLTATAGVAGVTPHSLRHYFASGLIAEGCDVVTQRRGPDPTGSGRLAAALVAVAGRVRTDGEIDAADLG